MIKSNMHLFNLFILNTIYMLCEYLLFTIALAISLKYVATSLLA